ncbi:hypothetical protein ACP4OV_028293 [Aristida adscensionis]
MAAQGTGGGEVELPAAHGGAGAGQGRRRQAKASAPPPEKLLNGFVRAVARIERVGNALGTLAFTWATVVLLGGYPTVLRPNDDFWFATAIVFLEATRMFSRNNRLDYQLFFNTRGAVRPLGWNGLILVLFFTSVWVFLINYYSYSRIGIPIVMVTPFVMGRFVPPRFGRLLICNPLRRAISLWSPLVIILLLGLSVFSERKIFDTYFYVHRRPVASMPKKLVFVVLSVVVLLTTISRLQFPRITKLVASVLGSKQEFWCRVILNLCMLAVGVMLVFMSPPYLHLLVTVFEVSAVTMVSLGNLQIPAAAVRIALAVIRLRPQYYYDDSAPSPNSSNSDTKNLTPSLNIFYGMVIGQGILYGVACLLEFFSFIPRISLACRGGFRSQWGMTSVNLYYAYAFEKYMEGNVLAPKKVRLSSFVMDSLNSDTPKMQLHGIWIMQSLLHGETTRSRFVTELNASKKTMHNLIRLLSRTHREDMTLRLFAAKVTAEFAKSLRVAISPEMIQGVSALLDSGNQRKRGNLLLDIDDEQEGRHTILIINGSQGERQDADSEDEMHDAVDNTINPLELEKQNLLNKQVCIAEQRPWIHRYWEWILELWSNPTDEPPTNLDILPALGLSILDSLASCDQDNCVAIRKASGLISKIIGFTSYKFDTTYTDAQKKVLVTSSLKLLIRLTGMDGEIGITLRHKVSKNPFLLSNLVQVLGDSMCSQESRMLVAVFLRNLAIDGNARQAIGCNHTIISFLMLAFLSPDGPLSTDADRLLRKVAGQALTMLAMDSGSNCKAMLRGTGYGFIKELTSMIHVDRYRYVAASLLRSICLHVGDELKEEDLKELSYSVREVQERIFRTEGAELEILIGLSSQISKVVPKEFARELEHGHMKTFVKQLIDALNANMEPSADCPGIRRVILEQAINMMEYGSYYVGCFNDCRMAEALSMVEQTASEAENYRLFLGDAGIMEAGEPLLSLVGRAKHLLTLHRT